MQMEKESLPQNNNDKNSQKTIYSPIYTQIILLAVHLYPKVTLEVLSGNWILIEVLSHWDRFICDY